MMPLNKIQLTQFKTKRLYSTVLFENIPQISLQIWLIFWLQDEVDDIVYIAMAFSVASIIISLLSQITQRNIVRSKDCVSIGFNVQSSDMITKTDKCKRKNKKIIAGVGSLLGIDKNLVEMTRPQDIKKGLRVNIVLYINHTKAIDMNIEKEINDIRASGELARVMKLGWNLNDTPIIDQMNINLQESKTRRNNTVKIQMETQTQALQAVNSVSTQNNQNVKDTDANNDLQTMELPAVIPPVSITDCGEE